jgi:hypothetical protein
MGQMRAIESAKKVMGFLKTAHGVMCLQYVPMVTASSPVTYEAFAAHTGATTSLHCGLTQNLFCQIKVQYMELNGSRAYFY